MVDEPSPEMNGVIRERAHVGGPDIEHMVRVGSPEGWATSGRFSISATVSWTSGSRDKRQASSAPLAPPPTMITRLPASRRVVMLGVADGPRFAHREA
jgi:hypothetical protein